MSFFSNIWDTATSVFKPVVDFVSDPLSEGIKFVGNLAGDLAGPAASYYGTQLQAQGAEDINAKTLEQVREQMAFQRKMSNTAWQRGMRDLRRSGLNPILAYQQGGASAPHGISMPLVNPYAGAGQALATGVSTAYQGQQVEGNLDKIQAEIEKARQDVRLSQSMESLNRVQERLTYANIDIAQASYSQIRTEVERMGLDMERIEADVRRLIALREKIVAEEKTLAGPGEESMIRAELYRKNKWMGVVDKIMEYIGKTPVGRMLRR